MAEETFGPGYQAAGIVAALAAIFVTLFYFIHQLRYPASPPNIRVLVVGSVVMFASLVIAVIGATT
jgi:hypothetical protein